MKSLELKPTYENLLATLSSDDIDRNKDVCLFAEIINSANESCSIALDGAWGSGKTFFVKQVKLFLDSHNDFIKTVNPQDRDAIKNIYRSKKQVEFEPQVCVYYDAWENDNEDEPILSLIYSIISSVDTDFTFSNNTNFIQKAAAILEFFTGKNWKDVIESFKGDSPFEKIKQGKEIQKEIKEFLDSLLAERGNRLVIFIDELDRCKPSYAVKLLERIKHYFDNDRITFVFSINTSELQHTIKKHYGDNFDACRYLDRFFDLRVTLPKPNLLGYFQSLNFNATRNTYDVICANVIAKYDFSLREIAKFLRIAKMAAYDPTHNDNKYDFIFPKEKTELFCLLYIVPLMIGLNIYNRDLYERFISGKDSTPLIDLLISYEKYWFSDLLSSNQTFDSNETEKTYVKFEDKIKEVYSALFVKKYTQTSYEVCVGKYKFYESTKNTLFSVMGLLSRYTDAYIDET